jgi:hypothetical protein
MTLEELENANTLITAILVERCPGSHIMVDIPLGWTELVHRLHDTIIECDAEYTVLQVKEKFGGLRFYVGKSAAYFCIQAAITEAEDKSYVTCETCGKPGKMTTPSNGWYRTLCEEHTNEHT